MAKNYYLILGVPVDAAPAAIRSAYRERAKRFHPDHGDSVDVQAFRDASEAYEVLSDPTRRARYDRELRRSFRRGAETAVGRKSDPEHLVSVAMPITGEPESVRPSFEALFERLTENFTGLGRTKVEQAEPLNFELILSREEAARGVVVPFQVPVLTPCPGCGGRGRDWLFDCEHCDGEGRLVDRRALNVRVPAGVRDGAVIEVSMDRLGIRNLWLRVHVRVDTY
jgi:DnaJ-class molecular chaperone